MTLQFHTMKLWTKRHGINIEFYLQTCNGNNVMDVLHVFVCIIDRRLHLAIKLLDSTTKVCINVTTDT